VLLLAAAREDVFEMFVGADRLVRWIGLSAEVDPRPGATFRFDDEGRGGPTPPPPSVDQLGWLRYGR
jgi:uncharacterized protein YndB with AHSA1/START domain